MPVPPELPPFTPLSTDVIISLGANFFGIILSWMLLGALIVQCYYYYLNFKRDSHAVQALVLFLLISSLVQSGVSTHHAYENLVPNWGNFEILLNPPRTAMAMCIVSGSIALITQFFFAWRIWVLGRSTATNILAGLITICSVLSFAGDLVGSITLLMINVNLANLHARTLRIAAFLWLGGSFAVDTVIAVAMIWLLNQARLATQYRATNSILTKLIRLTIQTGFLTAACALINLIFYLTSATLNELYVGPVYIFGKLYANSLVVNLNARRGGRYHDVNQSSLYTKSHQSSQAQTTTAGDTYGMDPLSVDSRGGVHVNISKNTKIDESLAWNTKRQI